ncbi:hypothetical protein B0H14DRAFT_2404777, partial [Mycena olivaceomarginata]
LGAIHTKGSLPGDVCGLMILCVAECHHEHVDRMEGLTTTQLWGMRDTSAMPLPSLLSPLQAAALVFADHSMVSVHIPADVTSALQEKLKLVATDKLNVGDLLIEAAAAVSIYNMVSCFLISLDVAGMSDNPVPCPVDCTEVQLLISQASADSKERSS